MVLYLVADAISSLSPGLEATFLAESPLKYAKILPRLPRHRMFRAIGCQSRKYCHIL